LHSIVQALFYPDLETLCSRLVGIDWINEFSGRVNDQLFSVTKWAKFYNSHHLEKGVYIFFRVKIVPSGQDSSTQDEV